MQIDLEQECLLIHKDEAMSVRVDVFVFFIMQQSKLTRASSLSVWASLVTTAVRHATPTPCPPLSVIADRHPCPVPYVSAKVSHFFKFLYI